MIVSGRSLLITRYDGLAVNAALTVLVNGTRPKTQGTAVVRSELVFNASNWDHAQDVYTAAVDDEFIDGGDALAFPAFEDRVNGVRGPLIIDGATVADSEDFLNNPLMLPGENNRPLATGTVTVAGVDFIVDYDATHVGNGARPGFDPRINDFPYQLTMLLGSLGLPSPVDTRGTSQDILSVGRGTPFAVALSYNNQAVPAGWISFYGTPEKTQAQGVQWTKATIQLGGVATVGQTWTLHLGAETVTYVVQAGDEVPSRVGSRLAQCLKGETFAGCSRSNPLPDYSVQVRMGLLGDANLIIERPGSTTPFRTWVDITGAGAPAATALVSGTPSAGPGTLDWRMASWRFSDAAGAATGTWALTFSYVNDAHQPLTKTVTFAGTGGGVEKLTRGLLQQLQQAAIDPDHDYAPEVSGSKLYLKTETPWTTQPLANDAYTVKPVNLNTRVDETVQVDTINVYNGDSPADESASSPRRTSAAWAWVARPSSAARPSRAASPTRTSRRSTSTSAPATTRSRSSPRTRGTTTVTGGDGNDTFNVKTVSGHTTIESGAGDDTINVSNDEGTVDQIAGLLTIDTGTGTDRVIVDDASRHQREYGHADRLDADRPRHAERAADAGHLHQGHQRPLPDLTHRHGLVRRTRVQRHRRPGRGRAAHALRHARPEGRDGPPRGQRHLHRDLHA